MTDSEPGALANPDLPHIAGADPPDSRAVPGAGRHCRVLQVVAPEVRHPGLTGEVKQLPAERSLLRPRAAGLTNSQTAHSSHPARTRAVLAGEDEHRRRLERDLHDGVQNELVALIVTLSLAAEDRDTPPPLARTLSALAARAQTALDSVREIARGIYPPLVAGFGIVEALRAQTARAPIDASLVGTAPRSTGEAEAAVYFSCLEALQNVAKRAGRGAQVTLRLRHDRGTLTARVEDDGQGFDLAHTPHGAGLSNIHDRIQTLGGTVKITSSPGRGTVLAISLPWQLRQAKTTPTDPQRSTANGRTR